MWLRDSAGEYVDIALAGKYPGAHGINEGADYTQYSHRMLYDWREPSAVDYFVDEVLRFILDSPELDGGESSPDRAFSILVACTESSKSLCGCSAFFDDVDFISALCVPGWYGSCGTSANGTVHAATPETCCGNWTQADGAALLDATTDAVIRVLRAFEAKGKTPVLSVQQDGWMSKETRLFHSRIMPAVRQHGGVVMMEALCQTGVGP